MKLARTSLSVTACLLALLSACGGAAEPADTPVGPRYWHAFRGPNCGVSPWANAPTDWDGPSERGVVWKTPLGVSGVSSPVLWGDRIFITEATDRERAVLAFDAGTGKQLWRQVVADGDTTGAPLPSVSDYGLAMPTATCDAQGVYALFGTGDLAAFTHDGRPTWRTFLGRPTIGYGFSSSPYALNGLLCVQYDHHAAGRMVAFESATGKIVWDVERSRGASWSSLLAVPDAAGKPLIVANANGSTTGFDLAGNVVWDVDGATGEVSPSPAWWDGKIYSVNTGSRLFCHRVYGNAEKLWDCGGHLSDTASPVAVNGLLFMTTGNGYLTCLDTTTGNKLWTERIPGGYASLLASGDRLYALGRDGTMQIVAVANRFRAIATCALGEAADATPAMSDGRLYIRGSAHLWCLGAQPAGTPQ
jgi:outer membrane protein assembly factor BamB